MQDTVDEELATVEHLERLGLGLDDSAITHIRRLLSVWGILADLSFSDLVLCIPKGTYLVIVGQVRPGTAATMLDQDLVGRSISVTNWPLAARAIVSRSILSEECDISFLATAGMQAHESPENPAARIECIPVCLPAGDPVALLARISPIDEPRRVGKLERTYRDLYQRLTAMVLTGKFPFNIDVGVAEAPRVGDGLVVTDGMARVTFASPNAINALHRFGTTKSVEGSLMEDIGISQDAVDRSISDGRPSIEEVESPPDVVVLIYAFPLIEADSITGTMVLIRDVTDLRRKDRLLLSKDAAIREVHHRVKNNLQTISSLLRLQARRLERGKGREELLEAERRVRSIAVVHEILSREPGEDVPFDHIVSSIVDMARDFVVSPDGFHGGRGSIDIEVEGRLGELPADLATPLAVAVAELLQNAIEHAFPHLLDGRIAGNGLDTSEDTTITGQPGIVKLSLTRAPHMLHISVRDNGTGLPANFDLASTSSLGLSLVKGLVESQLRGTITMRNVTLVDAVPGNDSDDEAPRATTSGAGMAGTDAKDMTGTVAEIGIPFSAGSPLQ
ncbi:MAG: sensor histidine kinase [Actinobacteria bacterium]|nr:sensor histidine kinase [Actinomycetota bacterium]